MFRALIYALLVLFLVTPSHSGTIDPDQRKRYMSACQSKGQKEHVCACGYEGNAGYVSYQHMELQIANIAGDKIRQKELKSAPGFNLEEYNKAALPGLTRSINCIAKRKRKGQSASQDKITDRAKKRQKLLRLKKRNRLQQLLGKPPSSKAATLNQTLIQAFHHQIKRCWFPGMTSNPISTNITLKFQLNKNGTLASEPIAIDQRTNQPSFKVAKHAAISAVKQCQPYRLPVEHYDKWKIVTWEFSYTAASK